MDCDRLERHERRNAYKQAQTSVRTEDEPGTQHCLQEPFATKMGTLPHQKDEGGVRHTSATATLDDVVGVIKHLTQTLENMDNQNRTRLDAIENTNHTMLKAICNFVRQDQHESTKDAMDDVAMSGTQNTCVNDQRLPCENPKKPMSTPTVKSTKNEAYSKSMGSFKNIETIFIPGDDDDEFIKPLPIGMKGSKSSYSSPRTLNLSGPNQVNTTDNSYPPEPFMSNYVTGLTAKDMPCCFKPTVDMNLIFEETQIILFMCLKVAYSQLYRTRSVWCMPPAFAVDVINGSPVETLIEHYGKDWMPPFSDLKLANVMLSVLEIVFPTQEFVIGFDGMDCWDIIEARGIPNCGSSEKSTLWVLEWMPMEESFVNLLYGVLEEKAVRMKVTMILLLGTHNQCRGELITNAERNWHDSIHGKH
ncbi:hypothetical protein JHK87_031508 [Glycine soja]|nr:hypothetical protein JHK87_031508 [Glycine soja]